MGDISIMARRWKNGTVEYGWSGNGGCYSPTGARLLEWYDDPKLVEYLFGLGQTKMIGKPGSEKGGFSWVNTHGLTGQPCWVSMSEQWIFSKIVFIDYGYFYDTDNKWYYVIPGPFRIKVPLNYIDQHLDENDREFEERHRIERMVIEYLLGDYYESDAGLQEYIRDKKYPQSMEEIREKISEEEWPIHFFWEHYKGIFDYFDDWVVIQTSEDDSEITGILLHKHQDDENRVETIDWK